jgi:hypothetical protein
MGGLLPYKSKSKCMGKNSDLIQLTDSELREIGGGVFPMLIIKLFGPNIAGLQSFWTGVRDGYERTTQE